MSDTKAYEFSRIFRQGWNAAKKLSADGDLEHACKDAEGLNPHTIAEERSRWLEGFEQALSSQAAPFNGPGGATWRAAKHKRDF